jgi:hypothetical protein
MANWSASRPAARRPAHAVGEDLAGAAFALAHQVQHVDHRVDIAPLELDTLGVLLRDQAVLVTFEGH